MKFIYCFFNEIAVENINKIIASIQINSTKIKSKKRLLFIKMIKAITKIIFIFCGYKLSIYQGINNNQGIK
jgi:hypothetical protein